VIVGLLGFGYAYAQYSALKDITCEQAQALNPERRCSSLTYPDGSIPALPTDPAIESSETSSAAATETSTTRPTVADGSPDLPRNDAEAGFPPKATATDTVKPAKTVEATGAFKLVIKTSYSCTANAPADWTIQSTDQSSTADLFSPGKTLYAGYGMQAVNTSLADFASAYGAPLDDPELYSADPATVAKAYGAIIVANLGGSGSLSFTSDYNQALGDYQLRSVRSSSHRGLILYHRTGFPGDGVNYAYALPMYFAFTTSSLWDTQGLLVAEIASSIRCTTQYQPRDQYVVSAKSSSSSSDGNGAADGYNPQLGTEYVHDSATGENYLVSPSTNWSSDGPSGAGYYKTNGNDYTLLQPGRSD
jgi:hypothetical protein